jgi:serine/threonine-protein kinase
MGLQVGQKIGGYELVDVLDSNRKRIAYRVRHLETGGVRQLHILPESLQNEPEKVERFLRQIRILASLSHPNIVSCDGAVQVNGRWAMTLEELEGVTLAERIELGPVPVDEAIAIMQQLLAAAECAHDKGIVHREITPRNAIITPDRVVKLTGFNFAKSATDAQLTQVGTMIGDVEYMSPEQVRGLDGVDARSDVYSLGALFYALLTGRPPFHSLSQFDVMMAHVNQFASPPSKVNPEIPAALDGPVTRALAKQPENRYATAADFWMAIQAAVVLPPSQPLPDAGAAVSRAPLIIPSDPLKRPQTKTQTETDTPSWFVLVIVVVILVAGLLVLSMAKNQ